MSLPLALSLVVVLPPVILALPPLTLGLGVYLVFRSLDRPPQHPDAPGPLARGEGARIIELPVRRASRGQR